MKDARPAGPIQNCPTKRFIPLAMNHFGLRGGRALQCKPKGIRLTAGSTPQRLHPHERSFRPLHEWRLTEDTGILGIQAYLGCPAASCCPAHLRHVCVLLFRVLPGLAPMDALLLVLNRMPLFCRIAGMGEGEGLTGSRIKLLGILVF
jgi:hypothetical protein